MPGKIYTIGHSNHSIDKFLSLLKGCGVTALADVRSHPYSRHFPQYSQSALKHSLQHVGIAYVFLGKELGARSENPDCYRGGKVRYELLAKEPQFSEGLNRLRKGMRNHCIAILCSEKDPLNCHRAILVARSLHENGTPVEHILADGHLESHADLESRMLRTLKMVELELFRTREEILSDAYERHGENIAYEDDSRHLPEGQGEEPL
jgi:uncharacterized protein (DUF488 family)